MRTSLESSPKKKKKDKKSSSKKDKKKRSPSPPVSDNEFEDRVGYLAETPSMVKKGVSKKSPDSFKSQKVSDNIIEEIRELKYNVKLLLSRQGNTRPEGIQIPGYVDSEESPVESERESIVSPLKTHQSIDSEN